MMSFILIQYCLPHTAHCTLNKLTKTQKVYEIDQVPATVYKIVFYLCRELK